MPVVLLCHCDGADGSIVFTDVSTYAHPMAPANGLKVSGTSPKFGTGSADTSANPANGLIDLTSGAADFNFGAGQFTVEVFAWFATTPSGAQIMLSQWSGTAGQLGWSFRMNSGALAFLYSTTGSDAPGVSASFAPSLSRWYHLAADRDAANVLRVYVDGAVIASATVASAFFASTQNVRIANDGVTSRGFPGKLDEIRISAGIAQYGGPFTPPTAPFGGVVSATQGQRVMVLA